MQLRDPAAETPAEAFARHLAAVDLAKPRPVRQPVTLGPSGGVKRQMWANAARGKAAAEKAREPRKPSGPQHRGRHRFPKLDYRAWAAELAAFCTVPRTMAEMVKRFGLTGECIGKRLQVARTNRCWPPAPLRERWVYTAPGKRGLVVERVG